MIQSVKALLMSRLSDDKLGFSLLSYLMGKSHILSTLEEKKKALCCQEVFKSYYFCRAYKNSAYSLSLLTRQKRLTHRPYFQNPVAIWAMHRCFGRTRTLQTQVFVHCIKTKAALLISVPFRTEFGGGEENQYLLGGEEGNQ